jgi:hypothetical protein
MVRFGMHVVDTCDMPLLSVIKQVANHMWRALSMRSVGVTSGVHDVQDLHTWHGIDAISQQQQIAQGAGKQYLLQQAGLVQQAPPGLMEELAQVKAPDGSTHRVRFLDDEAAFHRA